MKPNQVLPSLLALSCASVLGLSFPGAVRAALDPPAPAGAGPAEKAEEFPGLDLNRLHEALKQEAAKQGRRFVLTSEIIISLLKSSGMDAEKVDAMTANARARAADKGMHYYPDGINPNAVGKDGAPLKPEELFGLDLKRLKARINQDVTAGEDGVPTITISLRSLAIWLQDSGMDAKKVAAMNMDERAKFFDMVHGSWLHRKSSTAVGKDGAPLKPGELFGLDVERLRARIEQEKTVEGAGTALITTHLTITPESLATWLKDSGMDAKKVDAMDADERLEFMHMNLDRKSSSGQSDQPKGSAADLGGLNLPRFRARLKLDAAQQPGGKLTWNAAAARGWLRDNGMSAERAAALSDDEVKGLITEADASILAAPVAPGEFPADWTYDDKPAMRAQHAALEGKPMPDLEVSGWINGEVKPEDMKGKVVLLDLYATWCGPCMAGIPHNNALFKNYKDQGLVVVGVCTSGQGQETFASNAKEHGIQYPAACDPQEKSAKAWKVGYFPTYVVVDRKGIVRSVGLSPDHTEEVVKKLLAEPAS